MVNLHDLTDEDIDTILAGNEMDSLIALAMGYEDYPEIVPCYSEDISDAWEIVDHLWDKHQMYFSLLYSESIYFVYFNDGDAIYLGAGDSAPLAICRAGLKMARHG